MKKTRILSCVIAVFLVVGCFFSACSKDNADKNAFIDEIGGVSETYIGSLSEESYDTADDAAAAFVLEEIAEEDVTYTVTSAICDGTLTNEEIATAGISEDLLKDAKSVEKYTVAYSEEKSEAEGRAVTSRSVEKIEADGNGKKVVVYIISGEGWFKYFSPVVVTGETVTKGYYNSIFNSDKYKNCTFIQSVKAETKARMAGESMTILMSSDSIIRYDDNRIYIKMTTSSKGDGENASETVEMYIEKGENGGLDCYVLYNGKWTKTSLTDEGVLKPFSNNQFLHYSYFTKTDYGCSLAKKNLATYMSQAIGIALGNVGDSLEIDGYIDYFVSDGVLTGILGNVTVKMNYEGVAMDETVETTCKCVDYGTTKVESPIKGVE